LRELPLKLSELVKSQLIHFGINDFPHLTLLDIINIIAIPGHNQTHNCLEFRKNLKLRIDNWKQLDCIIAIKLYQKQILHGQDKANLPFPEG
jgi:hypothetical protein